MRPVKASELGSFKYCQRAWYYQDQGESNSNEANLQAGINLHQEHARGVKLAGILTGIAVMLILAAILLFIIPLIK